MIAGEGWRGGLEGVQLEKVTYFYIHYPYSPSLRFAGAFLLGHATFLPALLVQLFPSHLTLPPREMREMRRNR
jgi:hypothetical protein